MVRSAHHHHNVDKAVERPAEEELMVRNGDSPLCQSGLKPPDGSSAAGHAGSGQYSHLSSIEKLVMAESSLFFFHLFVS